MLLAGCVPVEPTVTPAPEPSTTPVFASEEEALAAAEEAYAAYQAAVDNALATYNTDALSDIATGAALEEALESVVLYQEDGRRIVGSSSISSETLADADLHSGDVQLYACLDISETRVFDSAGTDITPPGRASRFPMIVALILGEELSHLVVSEEEVWDGSDFC
jgi:hypothetical protein